jgi:hypothetical protein
MCWFRNCKPTYKQTLFNASIFSALNRVFLWIIIFIWNSSFEIWLFSSIVPFRRNRR